MVEPPPGSELATAGGEVGPGRGDATPAPAVRRDRLPRPRRDGGEPAALGRGVAAGVGLALALTAWIPLLNPAIHSLVRAMTELGPVGWRIGFFSLLALLSAAPLALAGLGARLVQGRIRREAAVSADQGRAFAAGLAMAASTVPFGIMALATLVWPFSTLDLVGNAFAIALGVGMLGGYAFRQVEEAAPGGTPRPLPGLYPALATLGLGVPFLCLTAAALAGVAGVTGYGLGAMARALVGLGLPHFLARGLPLVAVALPALYLTGRLARRLFPEAEGKSLGAGLALLSLLPFVAALTAPGLLNLARPLGLGSFTLALLALPVVGLAVRGRRHAPALPASPGAQALLPAAPEG